MLMNDQQLLRYSRHILLDEIDIAGQEKWLAAHALIIGAGGLASPAALYLASAGLGKVTIVDDDVVDLTNLQRQIAHTTERIGQAKVTSIKAAMTAINPDVVVVTINARVDGAQLATLLQDVDVVLDCSDNFATRHAVNAACRKAKVPLISGAAIGFEGQVSVFVPEKGAPCYACLFSPDRQFDEMQCATMGVFAPIVGIIGAVQAAEALKIVGNIGSSLAGQLLILDGRSMQWTTMRFDSDPACPVCAKGNAIERLR
jgi:molybdopterin/thiamine biosynthesis adenylyltransferase